MKYDVYLYEDCRVLKNKLNLKDEAELDKAESEFASISMMSLMDSGLFGFLRRRRLQDTQNHLR